jgi:hypothetical protein
MIGFVTAAQAGAQAFRDRDTLNAKLYAQHLKLSADWAEEMLRCDPRYVSPRHKKSAAHPRTFKCDGCGARETEIRNDRCRCAYCGSNA